MRHFLDDLWESAKSRYPRLRLYDQVFDQSHSHHLLVTILLFGAAGVVETAAVAVVLGHGSAALAITSRIGLPCGILGGIAGYLVREARALGHADHQRHAASLWDGTLDVLVPSAFAGVWAVTALVGEAPGWTGALLYVLAALIAWLYAFGRPDVLHYDRRFDPS